MENVGGISILFSHLTFSLFLIFFLPPHVLVENKNRNSEEMDIGAEGGGSNLSKRMSFGILKGFGILNINICEIEVSHHCALGTHVSATTVGVPGQ